tara:strand:- start:3433 stop:4239 length:807 start_codon:yes stop_codon:yes gene_type:complete
VIKKISIILTLYKTPFKKLNNLKQYKDFELLLFEQEGSKFLEKKLQKILKFKFKYYFSKKNIGLSKASNFLLSRVKSKYLLFTQPDIFIKKKEILNLKKIFKIDKSIIFVAPNMFSKKKEKKNKIRYTKKIKAACLLCDVKKLKKIGFFDEDFFLYWEDIDLMKRINHSKYKMVIADNIYANHDSSQSSENTLKIQHLRTLNFMFGELIYDLKYKKFRFIKIVRKIVQNFVLFFFNLIRFQLKDSLNNFSKMCGVVKFILYYLKNIRS